MNNKRENGLLAEGRQWAEGRSPWARILFLAYLVAVFHQHLRDPAYRSLFGGLNLGIHELGHLLAGPLGATLQIAAGTLAQCLAPAVAALLFRRQGDFFAVGFAGCWLGINFFEVATYAGDAVVRQLPLVSPFAGQPVHDWNYLLGMAGLLGHAAWVARLFRLAGGLCYFAGLAYAGWLILVMLQTRSAQRKPPSADG